MNLIPNNKLINLPELQSSLSSVIQPNLPNYSHSIWTLEDDLKLKELMTNSNITNKWKQISSYFVNKSPKQCYYRWNKVIKLQLNTSNWTLEEDQTIVNWVIQNGTADWQNLSNVLENRSPKSCKLRWYTTLSLNLSEIRWTTKEEFLVLLLVSNFGMNWEMIVPQFPNKTENEIKNKFFLLLRKFAKRVLSTNPNLTRFNVFRLNVEELLKFLPYALNEYNRKLKETGLISSSSICNSNCASITKSINICRTCGEKLKSELRNVLAKKIKVGEITQSPNNQWINSNLTQTSEKLKKLMSFLSNLSRSLK